MTQSNVIEVELTGGFSKVAAGLNDLFRLAGRSEWSKSGLLGLVGNAFSFELNEGAGPALQEANLDWWLIFKILPELEQDLPLRCFQERGEEGVKAAAWDAVRSSIDRGIPAVAWGPVSPEPAAARSWGLIVGYDVQESTYTFSESNDGRIAIDCDTIGQTGANDMFLSLIHI